MDPESKSADENLMNPFDDQDEVRDASPPASALLIETRFNVADVPYLAGSNTAYANSVLSRDQQGTLNEPFPA